MELAELLGIRLGVTAVIGGGGKTTLLRALGAGLAPLHRVLLCTTTKMYPVPGLPLARDFAELDRLRAACPLVCGGRELPGTGKLGPLEIPLAALEERFDYVLVEADGAAGRPAKAHAPHEPVIPPGAWRVCVVGASGFGRPIREAAHRPERYAILVGVRETDPVTPETTAAVLGGEALHDVFYVNQVETAAEAAAARDLARRLGGSGAAGSLRLGRFFPLP